MKVDKGFLKIIHAFPYDKNSNLQDKKAVIYSTLQQIQSNGYDGVVINADFGDGYIENNVNLELVKEKVKACKKLGLRVWIYDEKYYPSGAADTITLRDNPDLEARALVCVPTILNAKESKKICKPHGHLEQMGAFGYAFSGEKVTDKDLKNAVVFNWKDGEYNLVNNTDDKMLCLSFFTKYAFEGTHCQHNAATIRRYVDIGNQAIGKAFVENTYRPYHTTLKEYFDDGTIEAFFTDEPSYMACYFNMLKKPREVTHVHDEKVPLYAMVNWTKDVEKKFKEHYGYDLMANLPKLFIGNTEECGQVRIDYYTLLSKLASEGFFKPVSEFCEQNNTIFSGHILLEEKITDHLNYEGNFFTLLQNMQIPGMDMLDSIPEKVWKKAFTPLLISSISRIYREGDVFDEVSCHFQNKFSVPVSAENVFNSLAIQYALGATLFTSYYNDVSDPIQKKLPCGLTAINAIKKLMAETQTAQMPKVFVHYPIEGVMANKVSPVDMGRVYDSTLNESILPYPIDRADIGKNIVMDSIVQDTCHNTAKRLEADMENVMFSLMDSQVPFLFADTNAIDKVIKTNPKLFIVTPQNPTKQLKEKINSLLKAKVKVVIMINDDFGKDEYADCIGVTFVDNLTLLKCLLKDMGLLHTNGDTAGVVALWGGSKVLVVNSTAQIKDITFDFSTLSAKEYVYGKALQYENKNGKTKVTLPKYAVAVLER